MKNSVVIIALFFAPAVLFAQQEVNFDDYFIDKTMRIDFFQTGDADEEIITIDQIYQQGAWAGNPKKLIDNLNQGLYYIKVYDIASNKLIYSRGFNCIFGEYKTTIPAKNGVKKTYHESALIPYPKMPILFVIEARDRKNILHPLFIERIDPSDVNIIKQNHNKDDKVYESLKNGDPHDKVDFVFVAEGYTAEQWDKFKKDVKRFTGVLFTIEPYKSNKEKFNVSGVFRPSAESGVDQPTRGIFKNTVVSASYNALNLPRYLLVDDNKALRDIASAVPYDAVIVMTNTDRYGGGGIYNNYCIFTSDDKRSEDIFMHEFGHAFANLADEYYGGAVAYDEFYPAGVEPLEANITALLDPNNVKWKHLLSPGIEIPTKWGKQEYETLQAERQKYRREMRAKIAELTRQGASENKIKQIQEKYEEKVAEVDEKIKQVHSKYSHLDGKIGVFEGAGYKSKGLYRSEVRVGMFSGKVLGYGKVSEEAILRIIDHLSN